LARSAYDCAAVLGLIAGYHPSDESCADRPVDDYLSALTGELAGLRIGADRSRRFYPDDADPLLAQRFDAAMETLAELGAQVVEVELPYYDEVAAALWITVSCEALAYHRRDLGSRWLDYTPAARLNIASGVMYSGADYVQAARVRRIAQRALGSLMDAVDVVATPTSAITAPPAEALATPDAEKLISMVFTGYWNATGYPALVLPMGSGSTGLPLSLQLGGRPFDEGTLLRVGDSYQQASSWHRQVPSIAGEVTA
jgi:aspartyl-tRNA(Asn)/glutamyl-tRNA(Gln) amidotransferase subunit A